MRHVKTNSFIDIDYGYLDTINGIRFTRREIDIIACLLSGRATKAVAQFLSIEEKTVETHKYNIMRKLECNSKESIINFVEKSNKFSVVKKHYSKLLIQEIFGERIREISALVGTFSPACFIIYWRQAENKTLLVHWLKKYLNLVGIQVFVEMREDYKSLNHLVHKIESEPSGYTLYFSPPSLIDELHADNSKGKSEIFPFIQKHSQNPGSVVFLLKDTVENLPQVIEDIGYIDFSNQDNLYFPFLEILKKLSPSIALEKIIAEFKEQHELIYDSFEKPLNSTMLQEKNVIQKENLDSNNTFSGILRGHKKTLLSVGIFFLCVLCFLGFFTENKVYSTIQSDKSSSFTTFRSDLPIPHDNVLLERSDLISKLDAHFKSGQQGIQAIALVGIGGSGKTIIARQYARRQNGVVWEINAETMRSLRESFESFAYRLAVKEEEKKILMGLKDIKNPEEREEKILLFIKERLKFYPCWLLIFDNVEKFTSIQKYFPSDPVVWGTGKIIITTRNSNIENHNFINHTVPIKELKLEEKLDLFFKILNNKNMNEVSSIDKKKALAFLNNLPPFPLDISVAAYYLKTTNISYDDYISNINEHKDNFDSVQCEVLNEVGNYSKTRYNIVTLSIQRIINESKDFGEILLFISLLGPNNIPKDLLSSFKDSVIIDNFVHHLKKYSLLTNNPLSSPSSIPCLSIHKSTQNIAFSYLIKELKLEKDGLLLQNILNILYDYIDKAIEEENLFRIKILVAHIENILKNNPLLTDSIVGFVKSKLAFIYYFLNDIKESEKTIEESLKILNIKYSDEFSNKNKDKIAGSFLHIGDVYTELGYYDKAQKMFEQSLNYYDKGPFKNELGVAWALSNLGNVYRNLGAYDKARDLLEESRRIQGNYGSENNGRLARTLGYLGNVYRGLGDYKKSIETFEKSLNCYKGCFDENHFRVGWVLYQLGNIYRKLGDFEKSKTFLLEGLRIHEKNFSEDHIKIGLIFAYLGNAYREIEEYEKSKYFLEKSLNIYQKKCKENYEKISWISFHLGEVYMKLGERQKAKEIFDNVLIMYKFDNKKGDIEKAQILRNTGVIHLYEDQLIDAEILLNQSLEIMKQKQHARSYLTLERLAELYEKKYIQATKDGNEKDSQNFKNQAIHHLNQALEVITDHFPNHPTHLQRIQFKLLKFQ